MLSIHTLLQMVTILLALSGAYLVAHTADSMRMGRDYKLLGAKAFLNESFIKDNWKLLFFISFFFLINAAVELNEIFGLLIDGDISEYIQKVAFLGVLGCSVLSEYKWFKLVRPAKYDR